MKPNSFKILLFMLVCIILSASVFALNELHVRAEKIGCDIDFSIAVLNSVVAKVPQVANLSNLVNKLNSDKTQISELANTGNGSVFRQFVNGTLRPDMKSAHMELKNVRKNYKAWNVSKETRKELQNASKEARNVFTECVKQNTLKRVQLRIDRYNKILNEKETKVANLSSRNVSTAELTALINEARARIVNPLQNATNSGDGAQTQAALKQYCLFNDCKNGTNFHFNAKFTQTREAALLAYVTPRANAANLSSRVVDIQARIDQSKAALDTVGNAHATKPQMEAIWNPLKQVIKDFRQLLKDIKKAGKSR